MNILQLFKFFTINSNNDIWKIRMSNFNDICSYTCDKEKLHSPTQGQKEV